MELSELYSEVIKEHSISAHNKKHLPHATIVMPGRNPSCGDEIELELQVEDGIIKNGAFTGVGCAISQASVSIMIDLVRGRTAQDARRLAELFLKMALRQPLLPEELQELEDAAALQNISDMPARVKCATMPWHTLLKVLDNI
ncbi:Fe-S cluster assembly sulfur transfer protein SufU [Kineothrix sedimenti]|uniref:SUF system NifU family Fe-S cluster assembly protein n=1 Tax=Kineothrix sedimenti TaxID=3123317 RepID=A0ABZ3EVL7_9FIRM